jgi:hypothetical protein
MAEKQGQGNQSPNKLPNQSDVDPNIDAPPAKLVDYQTMGTIKAQAETNIKEDDPPKVNEGPNMLYIGGAAVLAAVAIGVGIMMKKK